MSPGPAAAGAGRGGAADAAAAGSSGGAAGVRANFFAAAHVFVETVAGISGGEWDRPGLGEWSVRDLVGHASRALSTVEAYLAVPADVVTIRRPGDYYQALEAARIDHGAVAERGRAAGAALGEHPAAVVRALGDRVLTLVARSPDGATLTVAGGKGATLSAYLPTRTFELTVHTLDLLGALGRNPPGELAAPVAACLELVGQLAGGRPGASTVLLALTGRRPLPAGFSVI